MTPALRLRTGRSPYQRAGVAVTRLGTVIEAGTISAAALLAILQDGNISIDRSSDGETFVPLSPIERQELIVEVEKALPALEAAVAADVEPTPEPTPETAPATGDDTTDAAAPPQPDTVAATAPVAGKPKGRNAKG